MFQENCGYEEQEEEEREEEEEEECGWLSAAPGHAVTQTGFVSLLGSVCPSGSRGPVLCVYLPPYITTTSTARDKRKKNSQAIWENPAFFIAALRGERVGGG